MRGRCKSNLAEGFLWLEYGFVCLADGMLHIFEGLLYGFQCLFGGGQVQARYIVKDKENEDKRIDN